MENNNLLIVAAIMAGAYFLTKKDNGAPQLPGNYYDVPGVGRVHESQLPSLGYQNVNGYWYTSAQVAAAAAQAGAQPGQTIEPGTTLWNTITSILSTVIGLTTYLITTITTANKTQAIDQILQKYTVAVSIDYNANFPYTRAQLEAMTVQQLQKILDTGSL